MAKNKKKSAGRGSNGANLGFKDKLWAAADKIRGSMDAAEYNHASLQDIVYHWKPTGTIVVAPAIEDLERLTRLADRPNNPRGGSKDAERGGGAASG